MPAVRSSVVTAVFLLIAALTAACSTSDDAGSANSSAQRAAGFPVTIDHKYGSATIDNTPQRVVALGFNEQDFVMALGVLPVAVRQTISFDAAQREWLPEFAKGKDIPTVGERSINIEKIASLKPDLIIGIHSYMTEDEYKKLSALAPTIAQPERYSDGATPWEEQMKITGEALGQKSKATQIIDETKKKFADVRAAHPEFEGKTAEFILGLTNQNSLKKRLGEDDYRTGWLTELGLKVNKTSEDVSMETIGSADKDVVMAEQVEPGILQTPALANLAAVREGRFIDLGDFSSKFGRALAFNSPLSLPFMLDLVTPQIAAALDGDPATRAQALPA